MSRSSNVRVVLTVKDINSTYIFENRGSDRCSEPDLGQASADNLAPSHPSAYRGPRDAVT